MKKLVLFLMMWVAASGMTVKADAIRIHGHVYDTITMAPLVHFPVYLDIDSCSNGFTYHNIVFTDVNGLYADTITFNSGPAPSGLLHEHIYDCRQNTQYQYFGFGPGNLTFEQNFRVCTGTPPPPCHADFYPVAGPPPPDPLTLHFINTSVGVNGPWLWLFGDGQSATTFDPIHTFAAPGVYHVTLLMGDTMSGGCFDMRMHEIQVGDTMTGCHANFTWAHDTMTSPRNVQFADLSTPAASTWLWNFGDSASGAGNISTLQNPTHTFSFNGVFHVCLTITTLHPQCTSIECKEIHIGPPPPPPCENWITHMNNWLNVNFEGHVIQNQPANYAWTFGDGTSGTGKNIQHSYTAPGFYTVSLTTVLQDSSQCTFTSSLQIHVGDSTIIHQVYGQVFEGNFPLGAGMVMIFSNDTIPGGMPFFAVCPIDSMGIYYFPYVPAGNYVIWAMPFDSVGGYLPTFYGDVLYWELATVIHLGDPTNPYNINLVHAGNMATGQGGINGHVNTAGLKSSNLDQITMLLTDEQGTAIGYRRVNAAGTFDFTGMAFGTYFLKPELPNVTSDNIKVVLSSTNPVAVVNMTYSGSNILGVSENPVVASFVAYPNPVKETLNLGINVTRSSTISAEVYNFSGQVALQQEFSLLKGGNQLRMDVSLLNSGLYTLRITSEDGIKIVQKFVKQ